MRVVPPWLPGAEGYGNDQSVTSDRCQWSLLGRISICIMYVTVSDNSVDNLWRRK